MTSYKLGHELCSLHLSIYERMQEFSPASIELLGIYLFLIKLFSMQEWS